MDYQSKVSQINKVAICPRGPCKEQMKPHESPYISMYSEPYFNKSLCLLEAMAKLLFHKFRK